MAELEEAGPEPGGLSAAGMVEARREDGTVILRLSGELDVTNADEVRAAVTAAMGSEPARVIIDLAALTYMDSSGVALILSVAQAADEVEIRRPTAIVRRLMELTGITEILRVTP